MNDLKSRLIKFARERYDYGQNKFEEFCGISRGTINKIPDGGGISTATLTKIILACPEMNIRWLLLGEGSMVEVDDKEKVPEIELRPTNDIHGNTNVFIANWGELKDVIREVLKEKQL